MHRSFISLFLLEQTGTYFIVMTQFVLILRMRTQSCVGGNEFCLLFFTSDTNGIFKTKQREFTEVVPILPRMGLDQGVTG